MSKIVTATEINVQVKGTESVAALNNELKKAESQLQMIADTEGKLNDNYTTQEKKVNDLKSSYESLNKDVLEASKLNMDKLGASSKKLTKGIKEFSAAGDDIASGNIGGALSSLRDGFNSTVEGAKEMKSSLKGVSGIKGGIKSLAATFKGKLTSALKVAKLAAKSFLSALGIGLLLVAVAAIVENWEKIAQWIGFGASEQEKQAKAAEKSAKASQDALTALEGTTNQLKLQGLSEKEILALKIKQTDEVIAKNKIAIDAQIAMNKDEKESVERNKARLKLVSRIAIEMATAVLRVVSAPIDAVIFVINKASELLGLGQAIDFSVNKKISELNDSLSDTAANLLFNPKEVISEGDETLKALEATQAKFLEKRAGFQLKVNAINKSASDKAIALANKSKEERDKIAAKDKEDKERLRLEAEAKDLEEYEKGVALEKQREIDKHKRQDDAANAAAAAKAKHDADEIAADKAKADAKIAIEQSAYGAARSFSNLIGELGAENIKVQKAQALIQVGIDTASAISSLVRMSSANPANAVTGGAAGALQFASGLLQITANIAKAVNILKAPIPSISGDSSGGQNGSPANTIQPDVQNTRVFVTETDITNAQTRVNNLNKIGIID